MIFQRVDKFGEEVEKEGNFLAMCVVGQIEKNLDFAENINDNSFCQDKILVLHFRHVFDKVF